MPFPLSPDHEKRLLAWLESNDVARDIIFFSPYRRNHRRMEPGVVYKRKDQYALEALRHVFAFDEDLKRRMSLHRSTETAALTIRTVVNNWKSRYQQINNGLGKELSNMEYAEIKALKNLDMLSVFNKGISDFALWKDLHVYWRTSPQYNQHFFETEAESKTSKPPINYTRKKLTATRRASIATKKRVARAVSMEGEYIDVDSIKHEGSINVHPNLSNDNKVPDVSTAGGTPFSTAANVTWSTDQLHQLEMARLEIERLDRENRRIELEAINQRAKEHHENKILMRKMLMKLASVEDSV